MPASSASVARQQISVSDGTEGSLSPTWKTKSRELGAALWSEKRSLRSVPGTVAQRMTLLRRSIDLLPIRAVPSFKICLVSFAWRMRMQRKRKVDAIRRAFSATYNAFSRCRAAQNPLIRTNQHHRPDGWMTVPAAKRYFAKSASGFRRADSQSFASKRT